MPGSLLTRELRSIRRVAPPDAPCEATLATIEQEAYLLVDCDHDLIARALRYAGAEHVWAPVDVFRRADGHDAMMPRVVEPLEMFLERRRSQAMYAGEIVTLACSVMRGLIELRHHDDGALATGRWWVTDAGKPVFAPTAGDPAAGASVRVMVLLAEHAQDRELVRLLADAEQACVASDIEQLADVERRLVLLAAPRPVDLGFLGSELETSALRAAPERVLAPRRAAFDRLPQAHDESRGGGLGAVAGELIAGLRSRVERLRPTRREPGRSSVRDRPAAARATTQASARGSARPPRRRVWGLAIALAIIVVAVGLLWPDGESSSEAEPEQAGHAESVTPAAPPEGSPSGDVVVPAEGEPSEATPAPAAQSPEVAGIVPEEGQPELTLVAAALLAAVGDCDATQTCADVLLDQELAGLVPAAGTIRLIDDYGGIAVFSVTVPEAAPITVVIEKRGEQWLIREVNAEAE